MSESIERNLGEQPIKALLQKHGLSNGDVVAASPQNLTHKLLARACKGRRLTSHSKRIVLETLQGLTKEPLKGSDLFNY